MTDSPPPALPGQWNDQLTDRLERARLRYEHRRPNSAALAKDAAAVMPGGQTRTVLHFDPFPFRVASASGATITDVDGLTYLDLLGNYTAGLLGHSPSAVKNAIAGALDNGWSLGATHPTEVRLAQLITARFPSIEQVRFTNSGTEANLMALAVALHHQRVTTPNSAPREKVLVFDGAYHGGVLTFGKERSTNVPHDFVAAVYNDPRTVTAALDDAPDIGAILLEPMLGSAGCLPASPAFLELLRTVSTERDIVLIFDEVMTSRLSPQGAQGRYGVLPDLTTLGKYLAGGMSFGAFGGRADLMAYFDQGHPHSLGHAGTFNNNVVSMAAGVATLTEVLTDERLNAVNTMGDELRLGLTERFSSARLPLSATGAGSLIALHPTNGPIERLGDAAGDDRWRELLFFDALEAGFYFARRGFIALSLEVTDVDVLEFIDFVTSWIADVERDC